MEPRTVSLDELDNLKVGRKDQLYWKDKPIAMERQIRLEGWTLVAAALLSGVHPFGVSLGWW